MSEYLKQYDMAVNAPELKTQEILQERFANAINKLEMCLFIALWPQLYACQYKMPELKRGITLTKVIQNSQTFKQVNYTMHRVIVF